MHLYIICMTRNIKAVTIKMLKLTFSNLNFEKHLIVYFLKTTIFLFFKISIACKIV